MNRRRLGFGIALVVLALVGQQAYMRFHKQRPRVAQATLVEPKVEQRSANDSNEWRETRIGSEFLAGDTLRTGPRARAELRLFPSGILKVGSNALLRFVLGEGDVATNRLSLETGEAEIVSGPRTWAFETQFGLATFDAGSTVHIVSTGGTLRFELLIGHGVIARRGERIDLGAGETIAFDLNGNVLEHAKPGAAEESPATQEPAADLDLPPSDVVELQLKGDARVRVAGGSSWKSLVGPGPHELAEGSSVKVGGRSSATLLRGGESAVVQGAATFTVGATGAPLLSIEDGQVSSVAGKSDTAIAVAGGTVEFRQHSGAGAVATMHVTRSGARVHVQAGLSELKGAKDRFIVRPGDTASLRRDGSIEATVEPPKRADISIRATESPVIHDTAKIVALGVDTGDACPREAVVEVVTSGRDFDHPYMVSRGEGRVVIGLPASGRYRVRCVEGGGVSNEVRRQGSIQVKRDSGEAVLPKRPSENVLDADGRRYTVLYQNFLPVLHFRWRAAKAAGLKLRIRGKGVEKSITVQGSQQTVQSGELEEGDYTWWFESASDPKNASPPTQLRIDFDNAAPTVHLREPKNGSFKVGDKVRVSGAALKEWSVQVNGQPVPTDAQYRFSTEAQTSSTQPAISIRLAHPDHGVHYYLRRAGGD